MWLAVLGLIFAAVPPIAWWRLARTRLIGWAVAVPLLMGAAVLVAVQHGWVIGLRADAHLVYAVAGTALIVCGCAWEHHQEGPGSRAWAHRRNGAIGLLGTLLAVTGAGSLLYALLMTEASMPSARAVPPLPAGLTVLSETSSCGSGNCYRLLEIGSTNGLSRDEIVRTLDRPRETCRPNGWLLDRRDLCIGVDDSEDPRGRVLLYVTLSNLLD
ncbi:MFS transporter [Streptomyces sp. NPDC059256]|uniref:MFS transporter n=1 Tax=Streptomyces sp. NPDC059256 TaxID=3346794 RepID=UPI0036AB75B4